MDVAALSKGMRVEVDGVTGVLTRITADNPKDPKAVRVLMKPENGAETEVQPEKLTLLVGAPVAYAPPKSAAVTNTNKLYNQMPALALIGAMEDRQPGRRQGQFIEDMERQGQIELTRGTDKLPVKGSENPAWKKMGVIFKDPVPGDEKVFRFAELPLGWKLEPTDHSMWNTLKDEQGRERAKMFYKAAFYDRSAHIDPCTRYRYQTEYQNLKDYDGPLRYVVKDEATGKVLFATDWLAKPKDRSNHDVMNEYYEKYDALGKVTEAWLNENRPQWRDASAYWGWD